MDTNPTQNGGQMPMGEKNENSVGGIVGIVIIIAILLIGGLYFWGKNLPASPDNQNAAVDESLTGSTSDETSNLESDLVDTSSSTNSVDVNNLDSTDSSGN